MSHGRIILSKLAAASVHVQTILVPRLQLVRVVLPNEFMFTCDVIQIHSITSVISTAHLEKQNTATLINEVLKAFESHGGNINCNNTDIPASMPSAPLIPPIIPPCCCCWTYWVPGGGGGTGTVRQTSKRQSIFCIQW